MVVSQVLDKKNPRLALTEHGGFAKICRDCKAKITLTALKDKVVILEVPMKELVVGQKVFCEYNGPGRISSIKGKQKLSVKKVNGIIFDSLDAAQFEICFYKGARISLTEAMLRGDDSIKIYEDDISKDYINLLQLCEARELNARLKTQEKEESDRLHQERIRESFDFKTPEETKKHGGKHVAINIRAELKSMFKNVKFSVTSDYDSVRIYCPKDFTSEQTTEITKRLARWESGYFDSRSDCHVIRQTNFNKVFGSCRFIFVDKSHN